MLPASTDLERSYRRVRVAAVSALAVSCFGLLLLIFVSYRLHLSCKDAEQWVVNTQEVLQDIEKMQVAAAEVIVGTRGFVIAGDEAFLEPRVSAARQIEADGERLRELVKDNPVQSRSLLQLQGLLDDLMVFGNRAVALRRENGFAPAAALIKTGRGLRLLKEIRQVADAMEAEEARLLLIRQGKAEELGRLATGALLSTGLLVILAISMAAWVAMTHIQERLQAEERLEQLERRYRAIFDQTFEFIGLVDSEGKLLEANRTALDFIGQTLESVVGRPFWETPWWSHSIAEQQRMKEALRQAVAGELVRTETNCLAPDGRLIYFDFSLKPVRNEKGEIVLFIPEGRDITTRKDALEAAQLSAAEALARGVELEEANKELEAFSYSVSHDLRTPLRAIHGFATSFLEDYGQQVDEEGRRRLGIVVSGASRMGQLIDDLLVFSRLGRTEMQMSHVHMQALVEAIFAELQADAAGRCFEFKATALPFVSGDRAMIRQALFNLLSNAVKFTRGKDPAVIEVACQSKGGELVFSIKDNGAGFDMKYANKLFCPFQRLHKASEYEGTGIGLAIVQRVIQRHGGKVWAEGMIGKGATVYFTFLTAGESSNARS